MSDSFEHHLRECSASSEAPYAFTLTLPSVKKPIQCYIWGPSPLQVDDNLKPSGTPKKSGTNIHLCIYTHGAGGTCASPGSDLLCRGLTQASGSGSPSEVTVLGFDGPMHLKTRTATFTAVINWASESSNVQCISLAGRSMGCRAAVIALTEALSSSKLSQKLVLQSYPLKGAGKGTKDYERKQILLDLPGTAHVLFESGDHDDMCALDDLESLRKEDMAAATSLVTIAGADHGLQLVAGVAGRGQKAQATEEIGLAAGKVAGEWLLSGNGVASHGTLRVLTGPEDESKSSLIEWSGLTRETTAPAKKAASTSKPSAPKSGRKRKTASPLAEPESSTQSPNIRTQTQSRKQRKK